MTVTIERVGPQKKPHAIFISAGDRETFASLALDTLTDTFDILIFFYGTSADKRDRLSKDATVFAAGAGTKFNALKEVYSQNRSILLRYQTVWVCDDDLLPDYGDVRMLPAISQAFGIKVLSPAHSRRGKISHEIMVPELGRHLFRYTSYIEMGAPLFATAELAKFLDAFSGTLGGYGDDWWFLNVLEADKSAVAAIVDAVALINPDNSKKPGGQREIELLGQVSDHRAKWREAMVRFNLRVWEHRNLAFVFPDKAGVSWLSPDSARLRRSPSSQIRTLLVELNYQLRFYKLRKRLTKRSGGG